MIATMATVGTISGLTAAWNTVNYIYNTVNGASMALTFTSKNFNFTSGYVAILNEDVLVINVEFLEELQEV